MRNALRLMAEIIHLITAVIVLFKLIY